MLFNHTFIILYVNNLCLIIIYFIMLLFITFFFLCIHQYLFLYVKNSKSQKATYLYYQTKSLCLFIFTFYLNVLYFYLMFIYLYSFTFLFILLFLYVYFTKIKKWCKKRLGAGAITRNDSSQSRSGMPASLRTGNTGNSNALKLVPASRQRTGRDFKRQSQIVWGTF